MGPIINGERKEKEKRESKKKKNDNDWWSEKEIEKLTISQGLSFTLPLVLC